MKNYTAVVEVDRRQPFTLDEIDNVYEQIPGVHAPSFSTSAYGYRTVRLTVQAPDVAQASFLAAAIATTGLRLTLADIVSLEVLSEANADLRVGGANVPELVGVTEAAELLGVSAQRVRQMIDEGKLAAHRVGDRAFALVRSEIEARAEAKSA
jgi:excisionase family DNA binding protein